MTALRLFAAIFLFLLTFHFNSHAYAQSTPAPAANFSSNRVSAPQQPGSLQVEIPRVYFVKGILWADIQIKNDTKQDIQDIMYGIQVLSPKTQGESFTGEAGEKSVHPGWLVGYQDYPFFTVKKGETVTRKMEYKMGSAFESGTYTLLLQVKSSDNQVIGYQTQTFPLLGDGKFLKLDPKTCLIQIGQTPFQLSDGPIVGSNDLANVTCDVTNSTSSQINAQYRLDYAKSSVSLNAQSKKETVNSNETVTLNPGDKKKISFRIPQVKEPQVYQGYLSLVNEAGNNLSPIIEFRWTVSGPSATIVYVNSDKSSYSQGSEAVITVLAEPSADLSWPNDPKKIDSELDNAILKVSLFGSGDKVCGEKSVPLPKTSETRNWPEQKVSVSVNKDCPNFIVKTEILNNDQVLAKVDKGYGILVAESRQNNDQTNSNSWSWVLAGILVLLALGAGAYIYMKKKRKDPPAPPAASTPPSAVKTAMLFLLMSLILAVGTLRVGGVLADTVKEPVDSPIEAPTVTSEDSGDDEGRGFNANASNFSSKTATGKSTINVNADCSVGDLYLYGHANHNYCSNFHPGLQAKVFIDDQVATISAVTSPDSEVITNGVCSGARTGCTIGGNSFILTSRGAGGGIRTGMAKIQIPASAQNGGQHKIEVLVGTAGKHYSSSGGYFIYNSFSNEFLNCGKNEPCYMSLTTNYACDKCPEGQQNPHNVCDPTSKTCKAINSCGVSTCTPGQNNCESCDNPNELKPHKACVNNACTTVEACGAPSCNSTADCCPAGQVYDETADKCVTPACNVSCPNDTFCQTAKDGCTSCLPNDTGTGNVCRPAAACNVACTKDGQCVGAKDGCTSCLPSDTGTGNVCRPVAACGVACTKDGQCVGAKDGCTACVGGVCKIPPACGVACTTKAECGGAKDGCSECLEGTCTDYSQNMCKCDGIVADVSYPSNAFKFEAFGKVEGSDVKKAEIADITFRMTKDNQVIAKSNPITPEIVEDTAAKRRFKAAWQTTPPAADKNSTYRVFADVRCKPKKIIASANEPTSSQSQAVVTPQIKQLPAPKGLVLITKAVNKIFAGKNETVNAATSRLLTMFSASTVNAQDANLQLKTLNFIKMMDTDNCRFVMWKFDETLF